MDGTDLGPGRIGQVSRYASDTAAAVAWYRDVLGLRHLFTAGDLAFFDCDGARLFLSPNEGSPGSPSILYFAVPDIHAAVATLTDRGVRFEGEPHRIFTQPDGTEEWMTSFHDPDDNLLALMSQVRPAGRPRPAAASRAGRLLGAGRVRRRRVTAAPGPSSSSAPSS